MSFNDRCALCGDDVGSEGNTVDGIAICDGHGDEDDALDRIVKLLERKAAVVQGLEGSPAAKEKLDSQLPIRMSKETREQLDLVSKAYRMPLNKVVNLLIQVGLKSLSLKAF